MNDPFSDDLTLQRDLTAAVKGVIAAGREPERAEIDLTARKIVVVIAPTKQTEIVDAKSANPGEPAVESNEQSEWNGI